MQSAVFKPLTENVSSEDDLEDEVHTATSKAICDFLKVDREDSAGMTIGLEGCWGSGKSHVINLVRKEFASTDDILFVSFDAWAHEGDPLRKAFLNELINTAISKLRGIRLQGGAEEHIVERLNKKSSEVNRGNETTVISDTSPSTLGLMLMLSLITTPVAVELLLSRENNWPDFYWGSLADADLKLIASIILLVPLIVAVLKVPMFFVSQSRVKSNNHYDKGTSKEEKDKEFFLLRLIKKVGHWLASLIPKRLASLFAPIRKLSPKIQAQKKDPSKFFQSTHTEFTKQQTMDNGEPTSWDFSKHYNNIVETVTGGNTAPFKKVIIVIDNIDRLSKQHARSVWSTLQTFFQSRSSSQKLVEQPVEHVWYLIPYDRQAFCEAIDGSLSRPSGTGDYSSQLGLLDKNFQVVFEIPPIVSSAWVQYFKDLTDSAFGNRWTREEIDEFNGEFERINSRLEVSPTIRQMRAVVNRAGALTMQTNHRASSKNICLYVCMRRRYGEQMLRDKLVSPQECEEFHDFNFNDDDLCQLASILFNVSHDRAAQVLLSKPIMNALRGVPDSDSISDLYSNHLTGFKVAWRHLSYDIDGLLESSPESVPNISGKLVELGWKNANLLEGYLDPLVNLWGRLFKESVKECDIELSINELELFVNYLHQYDSVCLEKLRKELVAGIGAVCFDETFDGPSTERILTFFIRAANIPELRSIWKPFNAVNVKPDAWLRFKRSEKRSALESDIKLATMPAHRARGIADGLNLFGTESSKDVWILEELFEQDPKNKVWGDLLERIAEWLETVAMTSAEQQLRLAHRIIDSESVQFKNEISSVTQLSTIKTPQLIVDETFTALFITRYLDNVQPPVNQHLTRFWNQNPGENEISDVITLFKGKPEKLWIQAASNRSKRARFYITKALPQFSRGSDYVALHFDQVVAHFGGHVASLASHVVAGGAVSKVFECFISDPQKHIKSLSLLSNHYEGDFSSDAGIDLSRLEKRHWLLLLKSSSKLCLSAGGNKELSAAFQDLMIAVIREPSTNLESFGIDQNYYEGLTKNIVGYKKEMKRELVDTFFSMERDTLSDKTFDILKDYFASAQHSLNEDDLSNMVHFWVKHNKVSRVNWFVGVEKWLKKYFRLLEGIRIKHGMPTNALNALKTALRKKRS